MIKIDALRAALELALPELRSDPDKLVIYVDRGRIVSRLSPGLAFEYRYEATLWLPGLTGGSDRIMVPLLLWLRTNQPDIFQRFDRDDTAIAFQADIIDSTTADVIIKFELTESVVATPRPDGSGWDIDRTAEPTLAEQAIADAFLAIVEPHDVHA
jgi:hypothetical protein